jgi:site-specific DNA recombinase
VLLSFAQFERELIAERTRDKIAAARRKGLWVGGMPLLGYDVVEPGSKLRVNAREVERVRAIFTLYLELGALPPVVKELNRRGWRTKRWATGKGQQRGGRHFTRGYLRRILTCVTYLGRVRYHDETYQGEHPAIVDAALWHQVQTLLRENRGPGRPRRPPSALLQGLLRCTACGCGMTSSHTTKRNRRYAYYVCAAATKRGWRSCPAPSVSAGAIEQLVLDQVRRAELPAREGDAAWETLTLSEQIGWLRNFIERIDYDGAQGKVSIAFLARSTVGQATQYPEVP